MADERSEDLYGHEHEDRKAGDPPRPASEPKGAEGSQETSKTRTNPATGEPSPGHPSNKG